MNNYATATVEGFVAQDPTLTVTKTGKQVCNFSLAVNHFTNPDSDPRVSYIDIETWEKIADFCSKTVQKGIRLLVIGSLRQDRWDGKDGKVQSRIKLIGNEIRFLQSPPKTEASMNGSDEEEQNADAQAG